MKLLVLSAYSEKVASARARIYMYLPRLRRDGYRVRVLEIADGLDDHESIAFRLRRALLLLVTLCAAPWFDVVLLHRVFPRPGWASGALGRVSRRFVLDYDESYHVDHLGEPVPPGFLARFQRAMAASDCTIVSNEYLREYATAYASDVVVIPTALDVGRYPSRRHAAKEQTIIAWIGSGGSQDYLSLLTAVFERLFDRYHDRVCLRVVTAPFYRVNLETRLPVRHVDWELASQYQYFEEFDIGIMPLPDNDRSRGKASYKALQYMAAGIPPVCSPVGMNVDVIEPGVTGFLPCSEDEWVDVLSRLIEEPDLRQEVGERGREMVRERFSTDRWYPAFKGALEG